MCVCVRAHYLQACLSVRMYVCDETASFLAVRSFLFFCFVLAFNDPSSFSSTLSLPPPVFVVVVLVLSSTCFSNPSSPNTHIQIHRKRTKTQTHMRMCSSQDVERSLARASVHTHIYSPFASIFLSRFMSGFGRGAVSRGCKRALWEHGARRTRTYATYQGKGERRVMCSG